jgi:hypothetical protein
MNRKRIVVAVALSAFLLCLFLSQHDPGTSRYYNSVKESQEVYALLCKRNGEFRSAKIFAHPKKKGSIVVKLDKSHLREGLNDYLKTLGMNSDFIVVGPDESIQ